MIKKSLKYLAIAAGNLIILTVLLASWTDKFELILNDSVRPIQFIKILCFTALSLIGMSILVYSLKKQNISSSTKTKLAAVLTIVLSSYLYVDYSVKFFKNIILNGRFRQDISEKIHPVKGLANGMAAENLTVKEYQQIARIKHFPELPVEATHIAYNYQHDDFLPDYSLSLTYYIPKEVNVNPINFKSGDFSKFQTFELIGDKKWVTYSEYQQ